MERFSGGDMSLLSSSTFEVLFTGRVAVSHRKAPNTFLDETVETFRRLQDGDGAGRARRSASFSSGTAQHGTAHSVVDHSQDIEEVEEGGGGGGVKRRHGSGTSVTSVASLPASLQERGEVTAATGGGLPLHRRRTISTSNPDLLAAVSETDTDDTGYTTAGSGSTHSSTSNESGGCPVATAAATSAATHVRRVAATGSNRTMLLIISQGEMFLLSPDTKCSMMERKFKDISFCSQGRKYPDYFMFICREPSAAAATAGSSHQLPILQPPLQPTTATSPDSSYMAYLFKCESDKVASDIMASLGAAFRAAYERQRIQSDLVCDSCPVHHYHKLCVQVQATRTTTSDCPPPRSHRSPQRPH